MTALVVTRSRVKEKCGVSDTAYDAAIDALIPEIGDAVEFGIAPEFLADTGNAGLQATLNLGVLEIVCAEFLLQRLREPGAADTFAFGGVSVTPGDVPADAAGLRARGEARLAPFRKPELVARTRVSAGPREEPS